MFRLGIIEESLKDKDMLEDLKMYFYSQKIENVYDDAVPVWHTNEYHIEENELLIVMDKLKDNLLDTWYIHAFDEEKLYVILQGKYFCISPKKDKSWNEMIKYGAKVGKVDKKFLKNIPLHI